ncbi:MAG: hypothetical protein ACI9T8_000348 [Candidatus Saccharimonadales bacterium]|jgi:hypothetical protein
MGARKAGEEEVRSITQNATGTYSVSLPIAAIRELKWQNHQKVTITRRGDKLIIEDWKS